MSSNKRNEKVRPIMRKILDRMSQSYADQHFVEIVAHFTDLGKQADFILAVEGGWPD